MILTDIKTNKLVKYFSKHNNLIIKKLDVTKKNSWNNLKKYLKKNNIKIDVLVNNAGFTNNAKSKSYNNNFFNLDEKSFNKVFDVNVKSIIFGCQTFGEEMIKKKSGSIINIASMYGINSPKHFLYPNTGISAPISYTASKSSVIGITKYLGTLWAKHNVKVNSISPGGIRQSSHKKKWLSRFNKLNPSGRMGYPHELNGALLFLISDDSKYCNGTNIVVDGGWTSW